MESEKRVAPTHIPVKARSAGLPNGFTLLEMVIALILAAVLTAVAGMGLVMGTQGFTFARENAVMAQHVQMAFARLNRELAGATGIAAENFSTGASKPYLIYDNISGRHAVQWVDDTLVLIDLPPTAATITTTGHLLLNGIVAAQCTLRKKDATTWTIGEDMKLLHEISIQLDLTRKSAGLSSITFTNSIYPRKI